MAPGGPRGATATATRPARGSASASRGRGGIAKRSRGGAAPRVDRDGDLVMDPTAAANGNKSGSGFSKPSKPPSGPARRNTPRTGPVASTAKLQQNLLRQIGGDTSRLPNGPRATRSQANTTTIKIFGLKASKAATNPDGGVKSLLEFLERKASGLSNHTVTIKKVCLRIQLLDTGGYGASPKVLSRFPAIFSAQRANKHIRLSPLMSLPWS